MHSTARNVVSLPRVCVQAAGVLSEGAMPIPRTASGLFVCLIYIQRYSDTRTNHKPRPNPHSKRCTHTRTHMHFSPPSTPSIHPSTHLPHALLRHRKHIPPLLPTSRQRALEPKLARHALNAVRRVDVLDQRDLVAGRAALARDDGAVGEEVLPYLRKSQKTRTSQPGKSP